ncbi:MAG: sulfotransferase domain-containing protein [Methyloceanibacter sp.]
MRRSEIGVDLAWFMRAHRRTSGRWGSVAAPPPSRAWTAGDKMVKSPASLLTWLRKRLRLKSAKPQHVGILVSYPKSGRTWLRVMLGELNLPLDYRHDGATDSRPRPFEELRLCDQEVYREKPVVLLSRDPRDTVVSCYFQKSLRLDGYAGAMADFVRDPLHGIEKIVRYNLAWLTRGVELSAFLPVTYEEIITDPVAVMRGIVDFIGVDRDDAEIERVVANNTFDRMRQREAGGEYSQRFRRKLSPSDPGNPESYKVRRGKVGGYVDYLSAEDIAYCDEILERYRYFDTCRELTLTKPARKGAWQSGKRNAGNETQARHPDRTLSH